MTAATRLALARLAFALEEGDVLAVGTCACGRLRGRTMTPRVRGALDALVAAAAAEPAPTGDVPADEPGPGRMRLLDVD